MHLLLSRAVQRLSPYLFGVFLTILGTGFSLAYDPTDKLPEGSRYSVLIESLDGRQSLAKDAYVDQYFPPASTLKIITALAAKLELGNQFHFKTQLHTHRQDAVIVFSGDPTLTSKQLKQLLVTAKKKGLKEIKGDLWLDNSAFSGYDRAVGWPWDILGVCYSAPASAITLDENCVQASIYTQKDGTTRVFVPEHQPIHVSTAAITVSSDVKRSTLCDLELLSFANNHYQLDGCLAQRKKPLPLKFAVQDSAKYTIQTLHKQLRKLGITLHGEVKVGAYPHKLPRRIAEHRSQPLPQLLEEMLKKSDNLIADNLTKAIGAHFYIQAGSFKNGTEAIKQIVFAQTGIDLSKARLADGSGLSRNNRLTPKTMAEILRYLWKHDEKLGLLALMPTSGESGTLKYRRSMRKDPIKGQLIAKSGSVYASYNMAGFGLNTQGQPSSLFVQFVTDYYPSKAKSAKNKVAPIVQFETLLYQDIVNFSQSIQ